MHRSAIRIFLTCAVLLSGLCSYSNLFCQDAHACFPHHHDQSVPAGDASGHGDPMHELSHSDQFWESAVPVLSFGTDECVFSDLYVPEAESNQCFLETPASPAGLLNAVFFRCSQPLLM